MVGSCFVYGELFCYIGISLQLTRFKRVRFLNSFVSVQNFSQTSCTGYLLVAGRGGLYHILGEESFSKRERPLANKWLGIDLILLGRCHGFVLFVVVAALAVKKSIVIIYDSVSASN